MDRTSNVQRIQWYVKCLRDVMDHKPVRGLDEAEGGYLAALGDLGQPSERERAADQVEMLLNLAGVPPHSSLAVRVEWALA